MSPEEFAEEVQERERECKEAEIKYEDLNAKAKSAKKVLEGHVQHLRDFIGQYGREEDMPLFDKDGDGDEEDDGEPGSILVRRTDGEPIDPEQKGLPGSGDLIDVEFEEVDPPIVETDDSWKAEPVETLSKFGLSERRVAQLREGGLPTIGAMSNFSNSGKQLTDLDGIGEAGATEIDDAMTAYWMDRAHKSAERPASPPKRKRKSA